MCRGADKAIDGYEQGYNPNGPGNSLAVSQAANSPYMVIDMGSNRTDIQAIRITPRVDSNQAESSDLNVYVSTNLTNDLRLVRLNLDFTANAESANVLLLPDTPVRYIVLQRMTNLVSGVLSIQEVTVLTAGGVQHLQTGTSTACDLSALLGCL